ncbi:hypothetical protein [Bacillus sp. PK3_68]|uniref:hypothetical protein n=1 Tax=Bacillus sp. PK3_68 TaxID=2027408 RepID=UPI000E70D430|nr:hypothetical protein [Bacillus sp. PK3_68]RJS62334.1 hypothetical protein CJ483_21665 [Bacillus sp. PK3_68]
MAVIIFFIVLAIIGVVALTIINTKAVSSEKTEEEIQQGTEMEGQSNNEVKALEMAEPIKPEEKKVESANNITLEVVDRQTSSTMNDQAYRKALQSFKETTKGDNIDHQPEKKIKDDEYRRALQAISEKNQLNKKD